MKADPFPVRRRTLRIVFGISLLSLIIVSRGFAFHESEWEGGEFELRGFIQATGAVGRNPDTPILYSDRSEAVGGAIARLLGFSRIGSRLTAELNAYQTYLATTEDRFTPTGTAASGVERSGALEWAELSDPDADARLGLDRFKLELSVDPVMISVGRQPVNLATTFYFTPNDFFAPFLPQAFFRVFKPGVDAARAEVRLGPLSQFSLIGVLGYEPDDDVDSGFSRTPATERASAIARLSVARFGFEWAVLGGTLQENAIAGGSLQGEVFDWLGVRAEGHYRIPRTGDGDSHGRAAMGLEHRFENSLSVRVEHYYNGDGHTSNEEWNKRFAAEPALLPYQAGQYSALDLGCEVSPLLTAEVLSIANWIDPSFLFAVYTVYSLSDESELSAGISIPAGERSGSTDLESEFGLYPASANLELRMYF